MEVDHPVIPELKRKLTPPQPAPEVDPEKKAKLAEEKTEQEKTKEAENKKAVSEPPITAEDIRKLKELLRQEEAKLLLIKRIKASIAIPEQGKKPSPASLTAATTVPSLPTTTSSSTVPSSNGIHAASPASLNATKSIGEMGSSAGAAAAKGSKSTTAENITHSSSSATGSKLEQVTQSFERSKSKREELKNELNQTLNSITTMPPSAHHDVNFFPTVVNAEFLALLGLEKCVGRLKRDEQARA
ncbi:unnamed protein product [Oikopleura dioica]|uniref:Transcriptional repressor p66 coiled-coil MBD2-interaction domain-containing protein n=1 Tax=Oikopleura dioica TaxID=34765 RepID=E4Z6A4_OIKDI|nr:unnamed protein product [Oikopleura dioica]